MKSIRDPETYKKNAFSKHIREVHEGKEADSVQFKVHVIKSYVKPLERQVREGVEIYNSQADIIMNSKLDYFQPAFRRMVFDDLFDDEDD